MKGGRISASSARPIVAIGSLLFTVVLLLPIAEATVDEGNTLVSLMNQWNVTMPGWVSGQDPCVHNWTAANVKCTGGHVTYLNMTRTGITGVIPPEIANLSYLEDLDVSNVYNNNTGSKNFLTGNLPDEIAKLRSLRSFNGSNVLEWNIKFPMVLTKFPAMEELCWTAAQLHGEFPDEFFDNLPLLRILYIGNNKLSGDLNKFLKFKNLQILSLYQSHFPQLIPPEMSTLQSLTYFNCHTCGLYGPLPDSFADLPNLNKLWLYQNSLTGPVPPSWKKIKTMKNLRLHENYLSGEFPQWVFTEWPQLFYLTLDTNSFHGANPNFTELDAKYNVSYDYTQLTWACNYLNGSMPCPKFDSCSLQTDARIFNDDFLFKYNCYADASQREFTSVSTQCESYHPVDVGCDDFYVNLNAGRCPPCPDGQVPWPGGNRTCVCTISDHKNHTAVPIEAVLGGALGLILIFIVIIIFILYKKREQFPFLDRFIVKKYLGSDTGWEVPPGVERFSKQDITRMTKDFNDENTIGEGGFGKVYLGTLEDGRQVAIKRASSSSLQGIYEFHNEITVLSRLHHRNLVRLYGFCDDDDCQILVYEYIPKGNLDSHLRGKVNKTPLHWYRRLEIAYGVARGLEYLHSYANPPVIHRDVKPTNILLDDEMEAKLADFGISKIHPELDTHISTRPAGTAGYLDPDYFMRRQLTTASDIYAFGVVLLELVTGQEAIDHSRMEEFNLIEWVKKRYKTHGIVSIVDPLVEHEYVPNLYSEVARLGLECSSFNRSDRPSIQAVIAALEPLMEMRPLYTIGNPFRNYSKKRRDDDNVADAWQLQTQRSLPTRSLLDSPDSTPQHPFQRTRSILDDSRDEITQHPPLRRMDSPDCSQTTALLDTVVHSPSVTSTSVSSDTVTSSSSNGNATHGLSSRLTDLARIIAPR